MPKTPATPTNRQHTHPINGMGPVQLANALDALAQSQALETCLANVTCRTCALNRMCPLGR